MTAAGRTAGDVAVRSVPLELLRSAAAAVTRTEVTRPTAWLADREFWNRTRWRRLPFWPRKRSPNQRAMDRTFVAFRLLLIGLFFAFGDRRLRLDGRRGACGRLIGIGRVRWFVSLNRLVLRFTGL